MIAKEHIYIDAVPNVSPGLKILKGDSFNFDTLPEFIKKEIKNMGYKKERAVFENNVQTKQEVASYIFSFLNKYKYLTKKQLAKLSGFAEQTVRSHCKQFIIDKKVFKIKLLSKGSRFVYAISKNLKPVIRKIT